MSVDLISFNYGTKSNKYCIRKENGIFRIKIAYGDPYPDTKITETTFKIGKKELLKRYLLQMHMFDKQNCEAVKPRHYIAILVDKLIILCTESKDPSTIEENIDCIVDIFDDIADNNQPDIPVQPTADNNQPDIPVQPTADNNQPDIPVQPTVAGNPKEIENINS